MHVVAFGIIDATNRAVIVTQPTAVFFPCDFVAACVAKIPMVRFVVFKNSVATVPHFIFGRI